MMNMECQLAVENTNLLLYKMKTVSQFQNYIFNRKILQKDINSSQSYYILYCISYEKFRKHTLYIEVPGFILSQLF